LSSSPFLDDTTRPHLRLRRVAVYASSAVRKRASIPEGREWHARVLHAHALLKAANITPGFAKHM
jgi:hypothetical protein